MDCIEVGLLGIMLMHRLDDRVVCFQLVVATVISCANPNLMLGDQVSYLLCSQTVARICLCPPSEYSIETTRNGWLYCLNFVM